MKSEIKYAIIFGVIIIITVGIISSYFSSLEETKFESSIINNGENNLVNMDKSRYKQAPELVGIAHYLNTTPEELEKNMEDKVVLYDIWTYSCINCIRTLPYITAWNEKYSDQGLIIIGIHSPEFEFEKNIENVKAAVKKHGITYPVVMDNDWETWNAFENRYWPRKYIADHEGYIRYDHIGEGAYKETEKVIQELLKERSLDFGIQNTAEASLVNIDEFKHSNFRTPELYFGYKLAQGRNQLGSDEGFNPEKIVTYRNPDRIDLHKFYPIGDWINHAESMVLKSESGSIKLLFNAKQVNIVTANNAEIQILLDGKPIPSEYAGTDVIGSVLNVRSPGLYNIIDSTIASTHELELIINSPEFEIFTFTFG